MKSIRVATAAAPAAIGPYAQAVWTGNFLFVSGQIPIDPATGGIVAGSAADQMRQCLKNVRAILEAAGLGLADVVKCTLFITDMSTFPALNAAYASAFEPPYPARSCVEVSRLPKDVAVEVEVIAARDD